MPQAGAVGTAPGGDGLFTDRLDAGEQVSSVTVCAGWLVDAIQITTDKQAYPKHGGAGGACQTLNLLPGEAISRVFGSAGSVINSLGFDTTNGRTFGPFGTAGVSGGAPFSMSTAGNFRGFTGTSAKYNDIVVLAQLNLIGDKSGGAGGAPFIDRMQNDERVQEVSICHRPGANVTSVQLRTNLGWHAKHGISDSLGSPTCNAVTLQSDEFITELFGNADQFVNALGLVTNKGRRFGPFGNPVGQGFSQTVQESAVEITPDMSDARKAEVLLLNEDRQRFVGLSGASGAWLDKISLMTHSVNILRGSDVFIDTLPPGEVIKRVRVCTYVNANFGTTIVRSLQAFTNVRELPRYGGPEGTGVSCNNIDFADGEFITEMFGGAGGAIDRIGFRTNLREIKPVGGPGGAPFLLLNPSSNAFYGFAGRLPTDDAFPVALDFAAPDLFPTVDPASASAPAQGWWDSVVKWPIIGIHASVLGDGRVLTYGSDGSGTQGAFIYDIWSPNLGTGLASHMTLPMTTGTDIFCSAQNLFANGQVLLAGGDDRLNGRYNGGVRDVNLFDPVTNTMTKQSTGLNYMRWYATQIMLPSGRVLVMGGTDAAAVGKNTPELYTPGAGWTLAGPEDFPIGGSYPRAFVAPIQSTTATTEEVYVVPTGTNKIYRVSVSKDGKVTATDAYPAGLGGTHTWQRPAVQYAPGKILISLEKPGNGAANVIVTLPNTVGGTVTVQDAASLSRPRLWSNFVLLPTGEVLALGGSEQDSGAAFMLDYTSRQAEIWTPPTTAVPTGAWRVAASELRPRLYHSTAMLLLDGRVLSVGGGAPGKVQNLNAQIYSPPYLYQAGGNGQLATRPTITDAPLTLVNNGSALYTIRTPQGSTVQKVYLTRMGSATHAFDFDARQVSLSIVARSSTAVQVLAPRSPHVAPPGRYMLTILNGNVPSVAKPVTVGQ
jgi:hypothetical protein